MNASDLRFVGNMKGTNGDGTTCQMGKDTCKRRKHTFGSSASVLVPVFSRKWLDLESTLYKHLSKLHRVSHHNNTTLLRHDFLRHGNLISRV
jgi:hypothetical protein